MVSRPLVACAFTPPPAPPFCELGTASSWRFSSRAGAVSRIGLVAFPGARSGPPHPPVALGRGRGRVHGSPLSSSRSARPPRPLPPSRLRRPSTPVTVPARYRGTSPLVPAKPVQGVYSQQVGPNGPRGGGVYVCAGVGACVCESRRIQGGEGYKNTDRWNQRKKSTPYIGSKPGPMEPVVPAGGGGA